VSVFSGSSEYCWSPNRALELFHEKCCDEGAELRGVNNDCLIFLPHGKRYIVELMICLRNHSKKTATIKLWQQSSGKKVFSKDYSFDGDQHNIDIYDELRIPDSSNSGSYLGLRLLTQNPLEIRSACIYIKEIEGCSSYQDSRQTGE